MRASEDEGDELAPVEAARDRRRDRHARAAERAGMRTGLAKQFKQVIDAQAKRARQAGRADAPPARPDGDEEPADDEDERGHGHDRPLGRERRRSSAHGGEAGARPD